MTESGWYGTILACYGLTGCPFSHSSCQSPSSGTHTRHLYLLGTFTDCTRSAIHQKIYQLNDSVKEPSMFHNYETEKITRKPSDVAENQQLYRVVRFFHLRYVMHDAFNVIL